MSAIRERFIRTFRSPTFLFASVAVLWPVLAWLWKSGRIGNGPVLCTFRLLTGHPCPMCGSTRAVCALAAGDLHAALQLNPLGVGFVAGSAILFLSQRTRRRFLYLGDRYSQRLGITRTSFSVSLAIPAYILMWVWNLRRW